MNQYESQHEYSGFTESERLLAQVAQRSFLKLWSVSNPFRDQGRVAGKGDGKELCDLLVIFGSTIIVFSDKSCEYIENDDVQIAWKRWYKRAIAASVKQLNGAARWLRNHPNHIYADKSCTERLLHAIPDENVTIHLVLVATGASDACKAFFNNSLRGSFVIRRSKDDDHITDTLPFHIGDVNSGSNDVVHVLNDANLRLILEELDTVADFVGYLEARKTLFETKRYIGAAGEEELLAAYLQYRSNSEKPFGLPAEAQGAVFDEGLWDQFAQHPQNIGRHELNQISYIWDNILNDFATHGLNGTLISGSANLSDSEPILRLMASETRFGRRVVSESLFDIVVNTPSCRTRFRTIPSLCTSNLYYVLMASWDLPGTPPELSRDFRKRYLIAYVQSVAYRYRDSDVRVIGLCTEGGACGEKSNDIILVDIKEWTEEMAEEVKNDRKVFNLHEEYQEVRYQNAEYPEVNVNRKETKIRKQSKTRATTKRKFKKRPPKKSR